MRIGRVPRSARWCAASEPIGVARVDLGACTSYARLAPAQALSLSLSMEMQALATNALARAIPSPVVICLDCRLPDAHLCPVGQDASGKRRIEGHPKGQR